MPAYGKCHFPTQLGICQEICLKFIAAKAAPTSTNPSLPTSTSATQRKHPEMVRIWHLQCYRGPRWCLYLISDDKYRIGADVHQLSVRVARCVDRVFLDWVTLDGFLSTFMTWLCLRGMTIPNGRCETCLEMRNLPGDARITCKKVVGGPNDPLKPRWAGHPISEQLSYAIYEIIIASSAGDFRYFHNFTSVFSYQSISMGEVRILN